MDLMTLAAIAADGAAVPAEVLPIAGGGTLGAVIAAAVAKFLNSQETKRNEEKIDKLREDYRDDHAEQNQKIHDLQVQLTAVATETGVELRNMNENIAAVRSTLDTFVPQLMEAITKGDR